MGKDGDPSKLDIHRHCSESNLHVVRSPGSNIGFLFFIFLLPLVTTCSLPCIFDEKAERNVNFYDILGCGGVKGGMLVVICVVEVEGMG